MKISSAWIASALSVAVCQDESEWAAAFEAHPDPNPRYPDKLEYFVAQSAKPPVGPWSVEEALPIRNWWLLSIPKGQNIHKRELEDVFPVGESKISRRAPVVSNFTTSLVERTSEPSVITQAREEFGIRDPLFGSQWHILNPLQTGHDMNVLPVWRRGVTGKGITVAIVDDGLDYTHPDFTHSFSIHGSWDYNAHRQLPTPELSDDTHGTRCAGEIAADINDECGVGIAPGAQVAGIRILSGRLVQVDEARALIHRMQINDIYSCSWGPSDDGKTIEGPPPIVRRAEVEGIENGRDGKGSIYVVASGNGASVGDNCNYDGYTNSIYSITVGAVDRYNAHPYYAEACSANMVVTYSSNSVDRIVTSDKIVRLHRPDGSDSEHMCTDHHTGTSAAAPIAASVFALVLEQRPELTWRDLQYLVRDTAKPFEIIPGGPGSIPSGMDGMSWQTTADGHQYHNAYGYGILDADLIVQAAATWKLLDPQTWYIGPKHNVELPIVGEEPAQHTITVTQENWDDHNLRRIEHVKVRVDYEHGYRGSLRFLLRSPAGIVSELAAPRPGDLSPQRVIDWDFMSVVHWGENGVGDWSIAVTGDANMAGTLHSWQLKLYGETADPAKAKRYSDDWNLYEQPAWVVKDAIDEATASHETAASQTSTSIGTNTADEDTQISSTSLHVSVTTTVTAEPTTDDNHEAIQSSSLASTSTTPVLPSNTEESSHPSPTGVSEQQDQDHHSLLFYLVISALGISVIVILASPILWCVTRRQRRHASRMDLGDFDLVPSDIELSDLDEDAQEVYLSDAGEQGNVERSTARPVSRLDDGDGNPQNFPGENEQLLERIE